MLDAYELISQERIEDVHSDASLLVHKKSGARIALLANDDKNKVFTIGFRTPPKNSTGVAHIIEHTVLCGSRKFPLKDPFVELAKGSLNTFLNAMTYPDKTVYPVASCNDTDFQNLMDVYLDAVFYPNIYRNEKIFRQEGWHYQMEKESDPLTYNGVVYNEMKGAFSSPEEVLNRAVLNHLFPDTPYGVESGGDPEEIPKLTYEEFLDFHRKYYHPSNCYICLYGNMDMEEKLRWLDQAYLGAFDRISVDSEIPFQKPLSGNCDVSMEYPVLEDEPVEDNTYLSESFVVGDYSDTLLNMSFSILEYVLLDAPGAPVKQALLDSGICKNVEGAYNDGTLQPFFSIIAQNANEKDKDRFLKIIRDTLEELTVSGIPKKALYSGINYYEFRFREADYASFPKGLFYVLDMFDSWLYDWKKPFDYLKELQVFETLKQKAQTDYFEQLIRKWLLQNPHAAVVTLVPKRGLAAEQDAGTARKLAEKKASLTPDQISEIIKETGELKAYQEAPDSPEAMDSLPVLKRSDISRSADLHLCTQECRVGETVFLKEKYDTNGIGYLRLMFNTEQVPDDLVPYLGLLRGVLGMIGTENYSYGELFHEINASTGGISFALQSLQVDKGRDNNKGYRMFTVSAKYLLPQQEFVFRMIQEILCRSCLDDTKRLYEIVAGIKSGMQQSIPAAGHSSAVRRAQASQSLLGAWSERTGGIEFYRLIENLEKNFGSEKEALVGKLQELMKILFRPENLYVSLTADDSGFDGVAEQVELLKKSLCASPCRKGAFTWRPEQKNEGFKTSGQVQYVAQTGNFRAAGCEYTGAFRILRVILNYDYLWMNLRVLGGAYGCMSAFRRSGESYLVSYRDPHLKRTLEVYRGLPDYLKNFQADERTMTKYIIGAISELDTPLNAAAKGDLAMTSWFAGLTEADFQKEREEVLDARPEDIRKLSAAAQAVLDADNRCVIGSESVLEKDGDVLSVIRPLVQG